MSNHSPRVYLNTPDMVPLGVVRSADGLYRLAVDTTGYGSESAAKSPTVDAFGRARVSAPTSVFDSKQVYDNQPLLYSEYTASTGATEYVQNRASTYLRSGTGAAGRALRQTKRYFNYQPGKSQQVFATFNFHGAEANVQKRVGYYDDQNGLFVQLSQVGGQPLYSIVKRSYVGGSLSTVTVDQTAWNIDPLDGTGPSGKTLNAAAAIILVIDFEWLGVGQVRIGFDFGGELIYAHRFAHANVGTAVYMQTPNLPVRWEIANTDTATGAPFMEAICCSVQSEGGLNPLAVQRSVSRGPTGANVDTTLRSMLAIRLKDAYKRATVFPLNATAVTLGTANYIGQLILNPTITGELSWTGITNSPVEYSVSPATIANGTVLTEFYGISTSPGKSGAAALTSSPDQNTVLTLAADYAGTRDVLVLAVRTLSGSDAAAMLALIDWLELL